MKNLVLRVLTALFLLPPLVYLIWRGPLWMLFGLSLLLGGHAFREWWEMCRFPRGLFFISCGAYFGAFFLASKTLPGALWLLVALPTFYFLVYFRKEDFLRHFTQALSGLFYLFLGFWALFLIASKGRGDLLFLLAVVILEDTGAYFGGRLLGRNPFFPRISPKKTREGFLLGLISGTLGGLAVNRWLGLYPWPLALFLGLALSLLSPAGDLLESMVKRSCGVKDSGRILPGHGGLLDRVDALLFVAPFFYAFLEVWG